MSALTDLSPEEFEAFRPRIASGVTARRYGDGIVAWPPASARPTPLDGVASVVFQIVDGSGTVSELVSDIHNVVGVPEAVARQQLRQVLDRLAAEGLLDGVANADALPTKVDLFPAPPNP